MEFVINPMSIDEITEISNSYTDENFGSDEIVRFVNIGISRINVAIKSKLPQFRLDEGTEYLHLDSDWMNVVVIPFVCWSIKMNDGSLNEAQSFLMQYRDGLSELQKNKITAIPEKYRNVGFTNAYQLSRYDKMRHQGMYRDSKDLSDHWLLDKPIQDMKVKDD